MHRVFRKATGQHLKKKSFYCIYYNYYYINYYYYDTILLHFCCCTILLLLLTTYELNLKINFLVWPKKVPNLLLTKTILSLSLSHIKKHTHIYTLYQEIEHRKKRNPCNSTNCVLLKTKMQTNQL